MLRIVLFVSGCVIFLIIFSVSVISLLENEKSASLKYFITGCVLALPFFFLAGTGFHGNGLTGWILAGTFLFVLILILIPLKPANFNKRSIPESGYDERDTMFSRNDLVPGSQQFIDYYKMRPENRVPDDLFRANPGLLRGGTVFYNKAAFAAAESTFETVERLHFLVSGMKSNNRINTDRETITTFIKNWGKKLGALDVGITKSKDYHFYVVGGRRERYGHPIGNNHEFAIVITVEMDRQMMASAPASPTVMESALQYLSSASIAVQLARLIRYLGYSARAHIDANYELLCPVIARDAGMGEIGRMGLLMTPRNGPRVRISAVTTDIPLDTDSSTHNPAMLYFCTHCKKCASACPAQAIPFEDRSNIDGVLRWQIDSEACFTYWTKAGTDCGRCVTVCPFSHPNTLLHNLVRKGIENSILFSRLALKLDDFFYGKRPSPKKIPGWLPGN
ncbi:MAG: 4Fe-4S dicluster domain-containing protein [Bacteroidales bacterium]|nr:MAG: 4Fe-4S dicluster domain-containing protein [Bacteroidales bacterium]